MAAIYPHLGKTRGRLRMSATIFYFISGIITASWASRIPDVQQKFMLNDAKWGAVLFSLSVGLVAGLSVASWLVEKFGTMKVMFVTTIIYLFLLCMLALAPSVFMLVIALFLFGVFRNISNLANNTNAVEVQRYFKKPVMATFHGIWSFACLAGAVVGTYFIRYNIIPLYHFVIVGVACLLLVLLYNHRRNRPAATKQGKKPFFIKPDRYLLILGLIAMCGMTCESTLFDWSVNYFVKVVQPTKGWITAGYTAFVITMTVGRLLGDRLIQKIGAMRMLKINGIIICLGFMAAIVFPTVAGAIAGFLLVGAGMSIVVPLVFMLAGQSGRMNASYAIASVTLLGYIGFLAGPLLVGTITNHFGMQAAFGVVGLFGLGITWLAAIMDKNNAVKPSLQA